MQKLWKLKACVSEKARRKHEAKIWKKSGKKKKIFVGNCNIPQFPTPFAKAKRLYNSRDTGHSGG